MKYKEWLKVWLENYAKLTVKNRTCARYAEIIKCHINPVLGDYELETLDSITLQKYITNLMEHGNLRTGKALSANSVNAIITVLQGSLRVAYKLKMIKDNLADNLIRPKSCEKQVQCFSVEEQKKIEEAALNGKKPYMFGVVICLYTGLRIGELLALRWTDIDFAENVMHITKSCHDGTRQDGTFGKIIDTPKTESSVRDIPIPKDLIPILKSYKKKSCTSWVISDGQREMTTRRYQRNFDSMLCKLGIPHHGFHALRHTFATRAVECGVDIKTLSEILGHKNTSITLNRYVHSLDERKVQMMNKLGKLLQ